MDENKIEYLIMSYRYCSNLLPTIPLNEPKIISVPQLVEMTGIYTKLIYQ